MCAADLKVKEPKIRAFHGQQKNRIDMVQVNESFRDMY